MVKIDALNKYQKNLVAKHYTDALKIGQSFKSSVLFDDEKENIAVHALLRAAKKYDKKHESKAVFSTYLYQSIKNSLLSYGRRNRGDGTYVTQNKRLPKNALLYESTIEANAAEKGQVANLSTLFAQLDNSAMMATYDNLNHLEHQELMEQIQLHLTEKQRFIFNSLMTPDVTFETLAKQLNVSRQRVHQQYIQIRKIIKRLIREGAITWTPIL